MLELLKRSQRQSLDDLAVLGHDFLERLLEILDALLARHVVRRLRQLERVEHALQLVEVPAIFLQSGTNF